MTKSVPSENVRHLNVSSIDWSTWTPTAVATLLFVRVEGKVLLMRKKRGLGAGLINAPGGKQEPGESVSETAKRETREELGVDVDAVTWAGEHRFEFTNGNRMHVHVFETREMRGTPVETDEAAPLWVEEDCVPFEQMWEDDVLWLPLLFRGKRFSCRFVVHGTSLLDHYVRELDDSEVSPM